MVADAETNEEQVSRISAAIARAKAGLDEVKAKVSEYDAQYKASETASAYLNAPITKAQNAFDELSTVALMLKDKSVEIPTKALSRTLTAANSALEQISETAAKYDDKFKLSSTIGKAVSVPREKCASALVEASNLAASVSAAANAQLQGVNQGISSRVMSLVGGVVGLSFSTAAAIQDRYDVETKAINAGTAALDKAKNLDQRYSLVDTAGSLATRGLETAQGLDTKVAGGRVTPLVMSAYEKGLAMATDGLAYVQTGYADAKQQRGSKGGNGGYEGEAAADAPAIAAEAPVVAEAVPAVAAEAAPVTNEVQEAQ